ncbi:MAG: PP2C family protein-serine/threonine phosphatase, partial [Calditrichia bacterium]|nr:PP2C family protein-serine/threonine phosphatase [Calditrichia bacterium]
MVIWLIGFAILIQVYYLYHFVEYANKELTRFLESVQLDDFARSFNRKKYGGSFSDLQNALTNLFQKFMKVRLEKEENFQYLQTVVQHVGVGLIVFKVNGEVELLNKAVKKLLGINQIKNIHTLEKDYPDLFSLMLKIKSGKQSLVPLEINGKSKHISVNATEMIMKKQKFKLISLYNIQSEIERERLTKELEIALQIQKKLLPDKGPELTGYDFSSLCLPAKEIGGDYYDYIQMENNQLTIIIGDVSGKGMPAAIYMTLTKGILQSFIHPSLSPSQVLIKANNILYRTLEKNFFVTVILGFLNPEDNKFVFSRAGHNPLIYFNAAEQNLSFLKPNGIGLGLDKGEKFQKSISETSIQLKKNDWLIFYTDGFTEAMNKQDEEYGEERLSNVIIENAQYSSEEMISAIKNSVKEFIQDRQQYDDMTM